MLDPKAAQVLQLLNTLHTSDGSPTAARAQFAAGAAALAALMKLPPVPYEDVVVPHSLGQTTCRLYRPAGARSTPLIYFHGGGFVLGSVEVYHPFTTYLAGELGMPVWSVEYPLAPESRFRDTAHLSYAVVRAIQERHGDVAVAGDSAGGTLAAAMTQMARDRGETGILATVLYCPAPDMGASGGSLDTFGRDYFPRLDTLAWFLSCYLERPEDADNPLASPARHPNLRDLPPTLVITAEYDPLRDSGEAYASALEAAGNDVVLRRYDSMVHDFVAFPLEQSWHALGQTRSFLDQRLRS